MCELCRPKKGSGRTFESGGARELNLEGSRGSEELSLFRFVFRIVVFVFVHFMLWPSDGLQLATSN